MSVARMLAQGAPAIVTPVGAEPRREAALARDLGVRSVRVPVLERGMEAASGRGQLKAADAKEVRQARPSALETVASYIPSEFLAAYLALIGMVQPSSARGKWWLFGGSLIVLALYVGLKWGVDFRKYAFMKQELRSAKERQLASQAAQPTWDPWRYPVTFVISALAFTAYAMAIPGTPFEAWLSSPTEVGGAVALALALLLPLAAELFSLPRTGLDQEAAPAGEQEEKRQQDRERMHAVSAGNGSPRGPGDGTRPGPGEQQFRFTETPYGGVQTPVVPSLPHQAAGDQQDAGDGSLNGAATEPTRTESPSQP